MIVDPGGRRNGRGAYLCREPACWTAAGRRGILDRALGVSVPDDIRMLLEAGPDAAAAHAVAIAGTTTSTIAPDPNQPQNHTPNPEPTPKEEPSGP